ncbi:hypothetical protein SARC_04308 [Sphaeroforma arctica JP610]|uniref:Major facilitator superfamily (MFS) profile domain-containing protein n=1 Tax=Sphaeroforma arctica JP610 TaxID=667725 RepID=A0A0L0G5A2_9EUKA|nr:hypothetical protein SARC_04308 [Sphaeroforma arctica JP610]KNC83443.1 hypothetical protein SARC_04308 [Sphaeroforma arctica JP610]|eukprot:XP_014157345.1 hypothetical protein SARC_04308 [Sphaeroforma arctica JP610]
MSNENASLLRGEDGQGHSTMRQRTMSGVSQRSIPNVPYYRPSATSETGLMSSSGPSDARKYFMISCAALITLFTAGTIFGFAAIKPIFIKEGAYSHLCDEPSPEGCAEQKLQLDLMFTLGSFFINVAAFPVGVFLDFTGPRITSTVGTVIEVAGLVLLAYSSDTFDGYMAGFICLSVGGLCMFLSNINLMNLFPAYMGTINVGRTCLYASVTDYTGRMFGFKTFGTIYGMLMMIAGFGNLLQYPIDNYVIEKCDHSFFKANLAMTIISVLLFILPAYLYRERERRFNSQYTPIN